MVFTSNNRSDNIKKQFAKKENMKKYYFINGNGEQMGPIAVEQFNNYGINKDTNVWCDGMSQWCKAGDIPELKGYFGQTPPPMPPKFTTSPSSQTPPIQPTLSNESCPNNYLVFSILATLLCCLPTGIAAIVSSTRVNTAWAQGNKAAALKHAEHAKLWCIISLGLGVISFIVSFILGFLGAL